jgi:aerobic-type carbon monoxide dehydrogenase small subunit (CoxS/CutS family)
MASARSVRFRVNGRGRTVAAAPRPLLTVLRDELGLTGAKYGCGAGQCGACTVVVDGKATRSCITGIETLADREVTTIEGLERRGALHPLQEAFISAGAMQCGYCVPGMIMSALALLGRNPDPDEVEIRRALQGNICRCGVYPRYVAAVKLAAAAARTKAQR